MQKACWTGLLLSQDGLSKSFLWSSAWRKLVCWGSCGDLVEWGSRTLKTRDHENCKTRFCTQHLWWWIHYCWSRIHCWSGTGLQRSFSSGSAWGFVPPPVQFKIQVDLPSGAKFCLWNVFFSWKIEESIHSPRLMNQRVVWLNFVESPQFCGKSGKIFKQSVALQTDSASTDAIRRLNFAFNAPLSWQKCNYVIWNRQRR